MISFALLISPGMRVAAEFDYLRKMYHKFLSAWKSFITQTRMPYQMH